MRAIITATLKADIPEDLFDPTFYSRQPREYAITDKLFSKKIVISRVRGYDNDVNGSQVTLDNMFHLLAFFDITGFREQVTR